MSGKSRGEPFDSFLHVPAATSAFPECVITTHFKDGEWLNGQALDRESGD